MSDARTPGGVERERDPAGRARNARPRDPTGRPLPRGAEGVERVPDDLSLPPSEGLALAQRYLDDASPFQAHEVLEACWKAAPKVERELWRGLAQLCVGLTHLQRGNLTGARTLLGRGTEHLRTYVGTVPHGIDVDRLVTWGSSATTTLRPSPLVLRAPPMPTSGA